MATTPAEILRQAEEARAAATLALQKAEAALAAIGGAAAATGGIDPLVFQLAIFALAVFVGYYVVWSVTPALHTPLMSVTNAISSVIVVGALLAVGVGTAGAMEAAPGGQGHGLPGSHPRGVNIFGGFLVTERMLSMYKKKG